MSRRCEEQIEVRVGPAGEPDLFLRRGRVYRVTAVQDRWVRRLPWWRHEESPELERLVWRVEARPGRTGQDGVYDLVQGPRWRLEQVAD